MNKISNSFYSAVVIVIALFFSTTVSTQPTQRQQGPPPIPDEEKITQMVDELAAEISLSKVQKAKISELYFAHFDDVKEVTGQSGRSRESQETMEKLKVDFEKEVKKYLSEDQQKGFEDYQEKQMSQRRKDRRPRQRG